MAPVGWIAYGITGRTPQWAVQGFVRLFCFTGGYSNDFFSRVISVCHPPRPLQYRPDVLTELSADERATAASNLRERGFHVFSRQVPADVCDRLQTFALTQVAQVRPGDGLAAGAGRHVYRPTNPLAVRYDFEQNDLINLPDVQNLMISPAFVTVAQDYLRAEPIADVVSMWWHTAFSSEPDSEAAQFYHFDLDRVKWIKYFIYLTDVDPDNGPHYFVAGSHRTGGIPSTLLDKGYARHFDEAIAPHYDRKHLIEFTGGRGTVIAEDTRGLHKGQHVMKGHRLVLQVQFSNSLYGPSYSRAQIRHPLSESIVQVLGGNPRILSAFAPRAH